MSNYTNDKLQVIADAVTAAMDKKGVEWFKPFADSNQASIYSRPVNATSQNKYNGFNYFWLMFVRDSAGYSSNQWATFKQIQGLGGKVLKGEKATPITYYGSHSKTVEIDGEAKKDYYKFLKIFNVFNLSQTNLNSLVADEQLKRDSVKPISEVERLNNIEAYVSNIKANIRHVENKCFYHMTYDYINMSPLDTWSAGSVYKSKEEAYYSALLHELAHWTGHEKRLNRDMTGFFGSESYAFEELVAEYSSAMLLGHLGISKEPSSNHAAYLTNWSRAIKKDPKKLLKSIALAQKVVNFLDSKQVNKPNTIREAA